MEICQVDAVFFSPTNTTEKIVKAVAEGAGIDTGQYVNETLLSPEESGIQNLAGGLLILGAPVYGGRVVPLAAERFSRLEPHSGAAVVIALYGNREYEDALLELKHIAEGLGRTVVAAGAFIGEHSFDSGENPIATGRPDGNDILRAKGFGKSIRQKLDDADDLSNIDVLNVSGNYPYKEWNPSTDVAPVTDVSLCTLCGTCEKVCPPGAISVGDGVVTNQSLCIWCSACVKRCPESARIWDHETVLNAAQWLSEHCAHRKEPVTFL